ncbi:MAG TPA: shikimate kinase [Bacillota bacterium]|nr:shikimate kinase [Bacillota bacterium]
MKTNLILIGMPGAGKSTIGVVLAKTLGKVYVDTDLLIQQAQQRLLQQIIQEDGVEALLAAEEQVVLQLQAQHAVVATGGSMVYSPMAMAHLKTLGLVIYLQLPLTELERRITNMASRGIAMGPGQQLSDLYRERVPLYEKYADLTVDCSGLSLEAAVTRITDWVTKQPIS